MRILEDLMLEIWASELKIEELSKQHLGIESLQQCQELVVWLEAQQLPPPSKTQSGPKRFRERAEDIGRSTCLSYPGGAKKLYQS